MQLDLQAPPTLKRAALAALVVAMPTLTACGGGAKEPVVPPTPSASASAPLEDAGPPADAAAPKAETISTVRFDDLGVSYAVPNGYRVLGDDALAAQVRASANPRLVAALEKRGSQKKGIPLLALAKETTDRGDGLTITISVTVVPKDATAAEVLAQQKKTMADNLESFAIVEDAAPKTVDGVEGSEIAVRYILRTNGEARRMASYLRIFVRRRDPDVALAYVAVSAFPEPLAKGDRTEEARLVLDGLHFYAPAP